MPDTMTDPGELPAALFAGDSDRLPGGLVHELHVTPGMRSEALLSACGAYRYVLTRSWGQPGPWCAWVMLNPSTADGQIDDPTVRRCKGYTRDWGYSGLVVVNLFGLRSTSPKLLRRHVDPVGPDNDAAIAAVFGSLHIGRTVVAWGNNVTTVPGERDVVVARELRRRGQQLQCLNVTVEGHPVHPVYQPKDARLREYVGSLV